MLKWQARHGSGVWAGDDEGETGERDRARQASGSGRGSSGLSLPHPSFSLPPWRRQRRCLNATTANQLPDRMLKLTPSAVNPPSLRRTWCASSASASPLSAMPCRTPAGLSRLACA